MWKLWRFFLFYLLWSLSRKIAATSNNLQLLNIEKHLLNPSIHRRISLLKSRNSFLFLHFKNGRSGNSIWGINHQKCISYFSTCKTASYLRISKRLYKVELDWDHLYISLSSQASTLVANFEYSNKNILVASSFMNVFKNHASTKEEQRTMLTQTSLVTWVLIMCLVFTVYMYIVSWSLMLLQTSV